ncbi:rhamnosyltransferase, partial [Escherichia coli]|uniref:glycosyltransferase n=1 Tax=Escherichia coli TaxID=562 RepID=UPI000BB73660
MLYIIVVSHFHEKYIARLLGNISVDRLENVKIIIKDNVKSPELKKICASYGVEYLSSEKKMGFGENNNYAVKNIMHKYTLKKEDYIFFINPDVIVSCEVIQDLYTYVIERNIQLFTIDLYKDFEMNIRDCSVRQFPNLKDFVSSYLFKKNPTIIQRDSITSPTVVDWCAGSFIGISSGLFKQLKGFDEKYYMYCEDIDLCFRAKKNGSQLVYLPSFKESVIAHILVTDSLCQNIIWS